MMSQSSQPDVSYGLTKLPTDVLLNIFDDCDVAEILNLSLTCKELRPVTEERHVWLTQFERLCAAFRQTQFHSRTKEPHVHSTAQLKSWAIQHARTDALWVQTEDADDNLALQSVRTNDPEHARYLTAILLPGGEYLVAFTTHGKFLLKKIERGNNMIGDSEWVLTDVARYTPPSLGVGECFNEVFTDTICDYPLIAYHDRDRRNASITIFHLDYDSGTISVQKRFRVNPRGRAYRIRHFAIRDDTILCFYGDFDGVYLEHLTVAKLDDPDDDTTRHLDMDRNLWIPRASLAVLTANAFIRYDDHGIYLYHIPHLSSRAQSQSGNGQSSTPSVVWSFCDFNRSERYGGLYYNRTDAILQNFYLHNGKRSHMIEFGMDVPAGTERDPRIRYTVVLKHTVTPRNDNSTHIIPFRVKGRKGAGFGYDPAIGGFRLDTLFVDDPDRCGHFGVFTRQHGVLDIGRQWFEKMEYDEVTGRVLFLVSEEYASTWGRLLLADLPRS